MAKIKIFLAAERIVEGIASSGRKDGHGTILDPTGVGWSLPLPLLDSHNPEAKVGEVTDVWVDGDKVRFRARVDSPDFFHQVQRKEKADVSVSFRKGKQETLPDGTIVHRIWTLTEISILPVGSNTDAKIERAVRKQRSRLIDLVTPPPAPPPPVIIDPAKTKAAEKAIEIGKIQDRLAVLSKARAKALAKMPRFDSPLKDETLKTVMQQALKVIEDERLHLMARQFDLENGVNLYTGKSAEPVAPKPKAQWIIKDLAKPEYPKGARLTGNEQLLDERRQEFETYYFDLLAKGASEGGFSPDDPIDLESLLIVRAESLAALFWEARRFQELEERVLAIEEHATRFAGVHQRSQPYQKGSLVIHGGALWCALRNVEPGIVPDGSSPADWQLAVKTGAVG